MSGRARPPAGGDDERLDDEQRLFLEAMRGVRPLARRDRVSPALAPPLPTARRARPAPARAALPPAAPLSISDPPLLEVEPRGEGLEARAAGVSRERLRALREGEIPHQAWLDLHGERADEAARRLEAFVRGALAGGRRCLLIVHGRGLRSGEAGPVLRTMVIDRLSRGPLAPSVLAFAPAPPRLGGPGALMVLLRTGRA